MTASAEDRAKKPRAGRTGAVRRRRAKASRRTLAEVQSIFQRAILEGEDAILPLINDSRKERRETLFGVYRNAYVLRLVEILGRSYEKLHAYLGDETFDGMARAYIAANPSHHPNGRWFGAKLPEFLRGAEPWKIYPQLSDLAEIERALEDVFDETDANSLTLYELSRFAPEEWARLVFTPHRAIRRLNLASNASAIWLALAAGIEPPEAVPLDECERVIAYRQQYTAYHRPMPYEEAMMWDEAASGVPFSILCELIATYGGEAGAPARAAGYLKGWIDAGLLATAVLR
jgi:hypothetical protein